MSPRVRIDDHGADDSSDSDIEFLPSPPRHLVRPTNRSSPIVVSSSDEEDDGDDIPLAESSAAARARKRARVSDDEGTPSKRRTRTAANGAPIAGPSRIGSAANPQAIPDDDSDNEAPSPGPIEFELPKADYLVPVVLEIIPDIDPEWVKENLERLMNELKASSSAPGQDAIDHLINAALETGDYPIIGGAPPEPEDIPDYKDPNYHRALRLGPGYETHAIDMLQTVFPSVPLTHIRAMFAQAGKQLVPTYQLLHPQSMAADKPYKALTRRRGGKGKGRAEDEDAEEVDVDLAGDDLAGLLEARKERAYLRDMMAKALEKEKENTETAAAKERAEAEREQRKLAAQERGDAVECQCCFDSEAPEDTAACPDGHFCCHGCIRQYAETKLGDQITEIRCMDGSGCEQLYTDATLALVLAEKTMSLYHRLKQMKELELADIPGLESCPFCPFAMVIENPDEKLFQCLNEGCRKVTCRQCRRPGHIPKRCEEVEADRKLDKRHAVEEAMSEALMRKCPKCAKPYVKESGCNKIYCHGCYTMSCYICQQPIKGYDHFDQTPGGPKGSGSGRCALWDKQENVTEAARITQARDAAAQRILAEAANEGVNIKEEDLRVDAPEAAAPVRPRLGDVLHAPHMERLHRLFDHQNLNLFRVPRAGQPLPGLEELQRRLQEVREIRRPQMEAAVQRMRDERAAMIQRAHNEGAALARMRALDRAREEMAELDRMMEGGLGERAALLQRVEADRAAREQRVAAAVEAARRHAEEVRQQVAAAFRAPPPGHYDIAAMLNMPILPRVPGPRAAAPGVPGLQPPQPGAAGGHPPPLALPPYPFLGPPPGLQGLLDLGALPVPPAPAGHRRRRVGRHRALRHGRDENPAPQPAAPPPPPAPEPRERAVRFQEHPVVIGNRPAVVPRLRGGHGPAAPEPDRRARRRPSAEDEAAARRPPHNPVGERPNRRPPPPIVEIPHYPRPPHVVVELNGDARRQRARLAAELDAAPLSPPAEPRRAVPRRRIVEPFVHEPQALSPPQQDRIDRLRHVAAEFSAP